MIGSSFFTQMSDFSDFTFDEEELILCRALRVIYHRSYPMMEMDNKMFKMRFRLSKYVIEGLELRLFSYICSHIFIHRTSNIFSPVSPRSRSSGMRRFVYYATGRHISFLICLLCCNIHFSELSLHLNCTDVNRVLFYTTKKTRNLISFSELGS